MFTEDPIQPETKQQKPSPHSLANKNPVYPEAHDDSSMCTDLDTHTENTTQDTPAEQEKLGPISSAHENQVCTPGTHKDHSYNKNVEVTLLHFAVI